METNKCRSGIILSDIYFIRIYTSIADTLTQWQVKYANSENENGNHTGDKAFDLQESTYWQTEESAEMPHLLVISLMFSYSEEE